MSEKTSNNNFPASAPVLPEVQLRKAVVASVIGNGLEWYDYMLYGFFSIFIAKAFFPDQSQFVQTLLTFLTFSFAFFFRPVGGVLLGIYSDKYGRKPALLLMLGLMAVSTVLMALTPSYSSIGLAATFIIILARIMQGISVGGEFGGATAMLAEYAPPGKRYFYASFQTFAQSFATFLAAGLGWAMVTLLSDEQAGSWGWRILFLLGGIVAPIGLYIRSQVPETPVFKVMEQSGEIVRSPLRETFADHKSAIIAGLGLVAIGGSANYVWFVFMTIFVVQELGLPVEAMFISDTLAGILLMIGIFISGRWCDKVGALKIFTLGVILFGASAYPLLAYVVAEPSFTRLIVTQATGSLFMALIWAPTPGIFASLFPATVRATGMSIAYNGGVIVFGAMAPPLLTVLIEWSGNLMVPAYYLILCAILSLVLMKISLSSGEITAAFSYSSESPAVK